MKSLKSILTAAAVLAFATFPNFGLAASVSASFSAEMRVEINSDDVPATQNESHYTGVIVDCRGLGLKTAASPVIKSETGRIIYGDKDLDFDLINEIGMAEYATNIGDTARAGNNPLIVKALKLENFNCNPVLSNNDAEKVVLADRMGEFFKGLKVVFLTD